MDLKRKIDLAEKHIRFISTADDTDSAVREAALTHLEQTIAAERQAMGERLQAKIAAQMGLEPAAEEAAQ
jgi:hypothetical protein